MNKRLREAIEGVGAKITAFNYDRLYLGGGDDGLHPIKKPPRMLKSLATREGLLRPIKLWRDVDANGRERLWQETGVTDTVQAPADAERPTPDKPGRKKRIPAPAWRNA